MRRRRAHIHALTALTRALGVLCPHAAQMRINTSAHMYRLLLWKPGLSGLKHALQAVGDGGVRAAILPDRETHGVSVVYRNGAF